MESLNSIKFIASYNLLTNVQKFLNIFQGYYRNSETKVKYMLGKEINTYLETVFWIIQFVYIEKQNKTKSSWIQCNRPTDEW